MKISYNQLFCRDSDSVDFIIHHNKISYTGHVAGIIMQKFGGVSYELGISGNKKHEIYQSLIYEDAPDGMKTNSGHDIAKIAEVKVDIIIPVTRYYNIQIPGYISDMHIDDGLDMESGWFDYLQENKIITEDEFANIEAIQISLKWEDISKVLEKKYSGIFPRKHIFPDIDIN